VHDKIHGVSHEYGGEDEISVDSLSGLLVDPQYTRVLDSGAYEGTSYTLDFDTGLRAQLDVDDVVVTLDAILSDLDDVSGISYDTGKVLVGDGSEFHADYLSHSALLGLTDDDHLEYLPRDGQRAMYGDLDMGSQEITNVTYVDGIDISEHDHDGDAPNVPMEGLLDINGFSKLDLGKYVDRPIPGIQDRVYTAYDSQVGFWYDDGSSWRALTTKNHQSLTGIKSDDHHSRYTDGEAITAINTDGDHGSTAQHDYYTDSDAITAINNDTDHGSTAQHNYFSGSHDDLTDVSVNDHISNITDIPNRDHNDLNNIGTSDHHVKTGDDEVYALTRYQSAQPGTPSAGMTYMDSDNDIIYVYDGTSWQGAKAEAAVGILSDLGDVTNVDYTDGYVLRADGSKYVSTTLNHDDLTNVNSDDHHSRYTNSEAVTAINDDSDHGSTAQHDYFSGSHDDLTDVSATDHIQNLNQIPTRSHDDLQNIDSSDHHVKTGDDEVYGLIHYDDSSPGDSQLGLAYVDTYDNILYVNDGTSFVGVKGASPSIFLEDIQDVSDVSYNAGYVLRADGSQYATSTLRHTDLTNVQPEQHHVAFVGLEDNQGVVVQPAPDDRVQFTDDEIVNADAVDSTVAFSIDQSKISHDSISGVSPDDHHNAFIGLEDEDGAVVDPAIDNRIQILGDDTISIVGSASVLNLSASVGNIHHDSLLGLTAHNHHYKTVDDEVYGLTRRQSNAPGSPSAGMTYMDAENDVIYVYDGTSWSGARAEAAVGQLSDLSDVQNIGYTDGYVLRASGSYYETSQLSHTDLGDIGSSAHHTRYSDEEAQDAVGPIVTGGTNIDVTYNDGVPSIVVDNTQSKYTDEEAQDAVGNIMVGTGATTVDYDDSTDTITIDSTQLNEETVQDYAWDVLDGTQTLINVTYDDQNDNVDFVVRESEINHNNLINGSQIDAHHTRYTDMEAINAVESYGALDISVTNSDMVDSYHASAFVLESGDSMSGNLKVPSLKFSDTVESDDHAGVILSSETTNDKHTYIHNYDNSLLFIDDRETVNTSPVPDINNTSDIFNDTKSQSAQWTDWDAAKPVTITIDSNNHDSSSIDYIYFDFENGRYCSDIKAEYYDGSWHTFYNTTNNDDELPFIHKSEFSEQVSGWIQLKFTFDGTLAYTDDLRIDEIGVFSPDEDEGFVMKRSGGNIYDTIDMNQNSIINASAYNGVDINTHITDADAHHWHDDHYGLIRYQSVPPGTTKFEQVYIDTDDDTLQVYDGGAWVTIAGGGTAPQNLSDLNDVTDVSYSAGYTLRANGSQYVTAQLDHSDLAGLSPDNHHTAFTPTDHDSRDHSPVASTMDLNELAAPSSQLDINYQDLDNVGVIDFDTTPSTTSHQEGRVRWNNTDKTLQADTEITDVSLQVGQEMYVRVQNNTGSTINNGDVVYINDGSSDNPTIGLAQANDKNKAHRTIGMATHDISDGSIGYVTTYGRIRGLDTSSYTLGDELWLSPDTAGGVTDTEPVGLDNRIKVGVVIRSDASDGIIFFNKTQFFNASDIKLNNAANASYTNLQQKLDHTAATGIYEGGAITDNGDGTIDISGGSAQIKTSSSWTAEVLEIDFSSATNLTPTDDDSTYYYLDYNGGSPTISSTTSRDSINFQDELYIGKVYRNGTDITIINTSQQVAGITTKGLYSTYYKDEVKRVTGLTLSETGNRYLQITAGLLFYGYTRIDISAKDTSGTDTFTYWYRDGSGGWTTTTGNTQVSNQQYDDGTGTLANIENNDYGVFWVYMGHDGKLHVQYGQNSYNKYADALNATIPDAPDLLGTFCTFIAKIIIEEDGTNFDDVLIPWMNGGVGGATVTDHGNLSGLGDDDHLQYLLHDGSRAMSGNLDMGTNNITNVGNVDGVDVSDHSTRHEDGGADELNVGGLSGELADPQTPKTHASTHYDGGTDELDAADLAGASGTSGQYLKTDGSTATWADIEAVSDHGNLTGLDDDDHTQYLLVDGTRTMSGNLNMDGNNINSVGALTTNTITVNNSMSADSITANTTLDWSAGEAFPNIIEQNSEPSLSSGAWGVWYDNDDDQMWLIINHGGDQRKVEIA